MNKFPENTLRFLPGPSGGDHVGAAPGFLPFFAATPLEYCNRDEGFEAQVKLLGAYTFPKIDVQIAGTYQSIPGGLEEAQYLEFSTGILGRPYGTSVVARFRYSRSWNLERSGWTGSTSSTCAFRRSSGLASPGRT